MTWFLILISAIYIPAFAGSAELLPSRTAGLLKQVIPQDGPNCFNTSLYAQGFTQDLVYTSETELNFFLMNFCSPQPVNSNLQSRDLIAFEDENRAQIAHTAVALTGNTILEKSSLAGSLTAANEGDPQPGQYLKRDISESLYAPRSSQILFETIFRQSVYRCQSEKAVAATLAAANKNPAIQEQLKVRKELAKVLKISDRKELDAKILKSLVPLMASMKWDQLKTTSSLETRYLQGLLRSNAYQMYLLNCSDSIKRSGECYAPHLRESTEQTDAWYKKIYAFEKKHRLD